MLKHYLAILALIATPMLALADPVFVDMDARHAVTLDMPAGWHRSYHPSAGSAAQVVYLSNSNAGLRIELAPLLPDSPFAQADDKDAFMTGTLAAPPSTGWVPLLAGPANVKSLTSPGVHGKYARFIAKGDAQPRYVTSGIFLLDTVLVGMTCTSNSLDDAGYTEALGIIQSLHQAARTNASATLHMALNASEKRYEVFLATGPAILRIPQGDLVQQQSSSTGLGDHDVPRFGLSDTRRGLILSGFIDYEQRFSGAEAEWQQVAKSMTALGQNIPQDISFTTIGPWQVTIWAKDSTTYLRADRQQADTWTGLRMAMRSYHPSSELREQLIALLKSVEVGDADGAKTSP